jgi:hypothetical protein
MVGSTLGVCSFGLIFVSARTNKRHHHQSNTRVFKTLRDHLLPKKEKGGPNSAQLQQLFMTSQMTLIINGEHEDIDLEMAEQIWDMSVVKPWADILALFEGKCRSGSSRFWSMMCTAVKSVNPKIRGQPSDFAVAATISNMHGKGS